MSTRQAKGTPDKLITVREKFHDDVKKIYENKLNLLEHYAEENHLRGIRIEETLLRVERRQCGEYVVMADMTSEECRAAILAAEAQVKTIKTQIIPDDSASSSSRRSSKSSEQLEAAQREKDLRAELAAEKKKKLDEVKAASKRAIEELSSEHKRKMEEAGLVCKRKKGAEEKEKGKLADAKFDEDMSIAMRKKKKIECGDEKKSSSDDSN